MASTYRAVAISNADTTADLDAFVPAAVGLTLMGVVARESAAAPAAASFNVQLGADADVEVETLGFFSIEASGTVGAMYGQRGVAADQGISIEHVSGEYDITIYYHLPD